MNSISVESQTSFNGLEMHMGNLYRSDTSSTAFWYQSEPHATFPELLSWEELEVNETKNISL